MRRYSEKRSLTERVFMAVACTLFTAIGFVMLVAGEGAERLWGLIGVVFFGVGGVVWFLLPRPTRAGREGVRTETITFRGSRRPALVFPLSRATLRLALVGTSAFTAVGILYVVYASSLAEAGNRNPTWLLFVGVVCTGVFGLMTVLGLVSELAAGTSVVLLPEGILGRGVVSAFVPLGRRRRRRDHRGQWNADGVLITRDPAAVETSALGRILMRHSWKRIGVDLGFAGLVAPLGVLEEAIREYVEHPEKRDRIGSEEPAALLEGARRPL